MVPDSLTQWFDLPVENWKPKETPDYKNKIYRLAMNWDDEVRLASQITDFLAGDGVSETIGLSLGINDHEASEFYAAATSLIAAKDKLPRLRGLFLGEMEQEESEISWIGNGDFSPFLEAFPALEDLRVRGGEIGCTATRHICLKKLVLESGGLPKEALPGILGSVFPELEHLEIWAGTDEYGWSGSADDLKPFLYENPFPKLKYLGLKNCNDQTEIAKLAAEAPVLDQLETLDLSLGTLRDEGGEALLASEKVKHLKLLDLHHHFMSDAMAKRFEDSGLEVDVSEQEEAYDGDYYYVSVGE
ncbi:MAG: STM4015 family protein [Verrucomicrobiota bacterium]